jgi:hypothetical protein
MSSTAPACVHRLDSRRHTELLTCREPKHSGLHCDKDERPGTRPQGRDADASSEDSVPDPTAANKASTGVLKVDEQRRTADTIV